MPITERTLKKWRKEALETKDLCTITDPLEHTIHEQATRILRMTQELLDQQLIRKG